MDFFSGVRKYKNPDSVSNIIVPITNVMNDNYCYQTSKKIRQVFDYKRRNGQYIGCLLYTSYCIRQWLELSNCRISQTICRVKTMKGRRSK